MIPIPTLGAQREFFRFAAEPNFTNAPGEHDEDLREPLVRRQGSQVSMRVARGCKMLRLCFGT